MARNYQDSKHIGRSWMLQALFLINGIIALAAVLGWNAVALVAADPLRWATTRAMAAQPGLFDYPYNLLWLLPIAGLAASWVAERAGNQRAARWLAAAPVLFLGLIVGWYYLAPTYWR